jgi:poly(A) polymerase
MREIWAMQPRLEKRVGRYPYRLIESPKFKAGYDFLLLRCETGQADAEIGQWWTDFWQGDEHVRADLMLQAKSQNQESAHHPAKKRRRRNRSRVAKSSPAEQNN